jgi:hypothetical protein
MNTLAMKKLSRTLTKPMNNRRKRLSLGMFGAFERSRIMKPKPPMVKRKLEANPSMMYWPFTLHRKEKKKDGYVTTPLKFVQYNADNEWSK